MSGGGKYGAFTAGALVGWTAAGTRPTFDVATGISSGAVVAVLAFLGPKYDEPLTRYLTTLRREDIYAWKPIRGLCMGTGVMTAAPLEKILELQVNDELMCDLRTAHAQGRRLYVGTGNILTNRLAVWDLGAIASSGRPDAALLVRKILVASCAAPGVVTPVEFTVEVNGVLYTELHADAGNLSQAFVRTPAGYPSGFDRLGPLGRQGLSRPVEGTAARLRPDRRSRVERALCPLPRRYRQTLRALCGDEGQLPPSRVAAGIPGDAQRL